MHMHMVDLNFHCDMSRFRPFHFRCMLSLINGGEENAWQRVGHGCVVSVGRTRCQREGQRSEKGETAHAHATAVQRRRATERCCEDCGSLRTLWPLREQVALPISEDASVTEAMAAQRNAETQSSAKEKQTTQQHRAGSECDTVDTRVRSARSGSIRIEARHAQRE